MILSAGQPSNMKTGVILIVHARHFFDSCQNCECQKSSQILILNSFGRRKWWQMMTYSAQKVPAIQLRNLEISMALFLICTSSINDYIDIFGTNSLDPSHTKCWNLRWWHRTVPWSSGPRSVRLDTMPGLRKQLFEGRSGAENQPKKTAQCHWSLHSW